MNTNQLHKLEAIVEQLSELNSELNSGGASKQFLRQRNTNGEVVIGGNNEGLIYFASQVLSLCLVSAEGAHVHFDAAGAMDECDAPVVIAKELPNWGA